MLGKCLNILENYVYLGRDSQEKLIKKFIEKFLDIYYTGNEEIGEVETNLKIKNPL